MKKQVESSDMQQGSCKYCRQIHQFETIGLSKEADLDDWATERCDCAEAQYHTQKKKSLEGAKENITKFFDKVPISGEVTIAILNMAADAMYEGKIDSLSLDIGNGCKGKISQNSKGKIKVERTDTRTVKYEQ